MVITMDNFEKEREHIHRKMLSAVSHDLKTPLATVIGSLEIYMRMDEKLAPDKKQQLLKSALTEAYRLDSFISNILDMAKLENHMVHVKSERCDLTTLLQDCIKKLGPKATDKGNIYLAAPNETSIVKTDPMLVGRAAGLLLDNALKHAGVKPNVVVEYGRVVESPDAFIRVKDNGPGIPAGKEEEIFSKYTRFNRSDQQNAGTGLGLAICRQIMVALGGGVEVKNNTGGGALFTLTFPAA